MKRIGPQVVLWLCALCLIDCVQVVQTPAPPEVKVKTPKPFLAAEAPTLEPTDQPDWFAAPSLDVSCYYYKPDKYWFRFFRNQWFQAFRWDGAWFALPENEIPPFLQAKAEIKPEIQQSKSKREQLKELERQLEEIERREQEAAGQAPPGDSAPDPDTAPSTGTAGPEPDAP